VAVSAPFTRLRSPEGTEQLGKRLLHLIGRHRHPRLQQPLRGRCVNGAYHVLLYPGAGLQTEAAIGVTVLNRMLAAGRPNSDRRRRVIK
jgi:hypothetical protein